MRRLILAAGVALFLVGELSANAPPPLPPKTKPTTTGPAPNPSPKADSESTSATPSKTSTLFIGSAIALTIASGGLLAFRRHSKQS